MTVLSALACIAVEKKSHSTIPVTTKRGYGTPSSESTFCSRPKKTANTPASSSGCSSAQKTPAIDCL